MTPQDCILIMPASGFSRRFGKADKLTADFRGSPLASYAARAAKAVGFAQMIAVVPSTSGTRADIFKAHGFDLVMNPSPDFGQQYSIGIGVRAANTGAKAFCVMLADMPFVPPQHIIELLAAAPSDGVIKTRYAGHMQPPAIFTGRARDAWVMADGQGDSLPSSALTEPERSLPLAAPYGEDVDTPHALKQLLTLLPDLAL